MTYILHIKKKNFFSREIKKTKSLLFDQTAYGEIGIYRSNFNMLFDQIKLKNFRNLPWIFVRSIYMIT